MDDLFEQLESGRKRKLTEHHIAGDILKTIFKIFLFITLTYFICSALCFTFVLERNESKGATTWDAYSPSNALHRPGLNQSILLPRNTKSNEDNVVVNWSAPLDIKYVVSPWPAMTINVTVGMPFRLDRKCAILLIPYKISQLGNHLWRFKPPILCYCQPRGYDLG